MALMNLLFVTTELFNPESFPYFFTEQRITARELATRLAETHSPEWVQLAATVLREARPEDALFFVSVETIADHWEELADHLGPTRGRWRWIVDQAMVMALAQVLGPEKDGESKKSKR